MNGQTAFYNALRDPELPLPDGLLTWNGSDPTPRFAIYRNNVMASLIDALADTCPVTQLLVGEAFFRAMAKIYIEQTPPTSPILADYGDSFPQFIADFPPAASVPYLADLTRLEILRVHAYHAADCDHSSYSNLEMALMDTASLPDLHASLHPSTGILSSPYAIASIWAAHQGTGRLENIDPNQAEHVLVIRPLLEVDVLLIDEGTAQFIACLQQGTSLGLALALTSQQIPDFELTTALDVLIRNRVLLSFYP
ncbi:MAG: DUF2063 domain-containing protein [Gammaproteobacteria bacterium]|nr:DUF2063 domain-containing protein [Gammaproteobacteria bacterium]